MTLTELVTSLRLDFGDPNGELLDDASVQRAITRALSLVNSDLDTSYTFENGSLSPTPDDQFREVLLFRALGFVCSTMRAVCARNFSFSSGDMRVDKTRQADYWAKQEEDVLKQYRDKVEQLNPTDPFNNLKPLIYEIDSEPPDEC